jgi:tricorn protease
MKRLFVLVALLLALPLPASANGPDVNDTKLLTQPAVSANHVAFVYAEDLWICTHDGKNVRRLTTDLGMESNPVFSPDGRFIAFSGQYDGNTDVFIMPVEGGAPKRLTYHPGADGVRGFTPDGSAVLFASGRNTFTRRYNQLFTVPVEGGYETQLPIPNAYHASYSPDGTRIAYTPLSEPFRQWKNYRGGTNSRILLYTASNHAVEQIPQPADRCNDTDPQWLDKNTILFRSDRNGEFNLFTYDSTSKKIAQVSQHDDFPVLDHCVGGGFVVFEQAGHLHMTKVNENANLSPMGRMKIGVATDMPERRARFVKGGTYVRGAAVSPSGARAVFEMRGEIVTVPAEKGDPRNLTNTPGVHERNPEWSPDGKTIAYFSDASGDYELCLQSQDGKGEAKRIKLNGSGFYNDLSWSRDSKKIAIVDSASTLSWVDVASGKITKIVTAQYGRARGLKPTSWAPDSKWLAYSIDNAAQIAQVHIYSLEQNKSFPVTDGMSEATEPVFDANGKYLYFMGSTDTGMSKHGFSQSSQDSRPPRWSLYLAVLRKDLPSPFIRESDEEKGMQERRNEERRNEERRPGEGGERTEGGGQGEERPGREMPEGAADRMKAVREARQAKENTKIDFEAIDQRILALPVSSGNYANLHAGSANQLYFMARASADEGRGGRGPGAGATGSALHRYDLERKRDDTVQASVMSYMLTPDARKMLISTGRNTYAIVSTTGGAAPTPQAAPQMAGRGGRGGRGGAEPSPAEATPTPGRLNLDAVDIKIEPESEWAQIYHEAWRINRDFFYAPNMHGADWTKMREKYRPFLDHCATREDVNRVIQWMCSELAVGHHRGGGGDRLYERRTSVRGGLLGADYEVADGRYRFKKIYGGLNWSPELRAPLTVPGVNVKEGEFLLAVQGRDLKAPDNLFKHFENTSGKMIEITVGPSADGKGSRTVVVEPIEDEGNLRNRAWVEGNLKKVHEATKGRVAYVYVPDTAQGGLTSFKRYFFPQVDKEAIIVDERFNSGGQIADYYIDILRRPFASYWAPRHGADWRSPSAAIHGPKVMIIDETAGSGGDMLPWMFHKFQLGPIVGKRTWGGLVGISGTPTLMDGGSITAPGFAIWTPEEGWVVENVGVPPTIEVEQTPADVIAGRDPQLEKAIEVVLKELEKQPKVDHKRPAFPMRALPSARGGATNGNNNK